ncbi:hypothetical protein M1555_05430 [Patescibacteria group bacterium]|nr:hypothetical protein [Patescibacteria group bacterium]
MITFRYKEEPLGENGQSIMRPVADVFLKTTSGAWIEYHPYIDSGADVSVIPLSLGRLIGLTTGQTVTSDIAGVSGSIPVVYKSVQMKIGSAGFPVTVTWALTEDVPALLGRTDIFDRFTVTFRQSENTITFA